jgi:Lactonase, 7-bladed beta-propeller
MQTLRKFFLASSSLVLCLFFTFLFLLPTAFAASGPTIQVVSPGNGANVGTPIYFEAYSYSTTCKSGINAMRIYSAPNTPAATVSSNHVETFISLTPGRYTTTIVAYDNCGGVSATNIPLTVNSNTGVTVYLPSAISANGPVHIAASAKSYVCANDVQAMRIYTSPGVAPYSLFGNQVDAFLTLAPGTYNIVAQAWDNCGNVLKSSFPLTVNAAPDKFLYTTGGTTAPNYNTDLLVFPLSNGTLRSSYLVTNFGKSSGLSLTEIAIDPAGYLLYTTDGHSIFGLQIDRNDGSLQGVPGSPYFIANPPSGGLIRIAMDPNGHFLYVSDPVKQTVSSYEIDRSDGSLNLARSTTAPAGWLITNYTGALVYDVSYSESSKTEQINGFSVDTNTGELTEAPGSPYTVPGEFNLVFPPTAAWKYLYLAQEHTCCTGLQTTGYVINSDGSLSAVPGSPFISENDYASIVNPVADWLTRYYWYSASFPATAFDNLIETSDIDGSTGALSPNFSTSSGGPSYEFLVEDHSGKYLYSTGENNQNLSNCVSGIYCPDVFGSWTIGPSGQPIPLSGPVASGYVSGSSSTIVAATSR